MWPSWLTVESYCLVCEIVVYYCLYCSWIKFLILSMILMLSSQIHRNFQHSATQFRPCCESKMAAASNMTSHIKRNLKGSQNQTVIWYILKLIFLALKWHKNLDVLLRCYDQIWTNSCKHSWKTWFPKIWKKSLDRDKPLRLKPFSYQISSKMRPIFIPQIWNKIYQKFYIVFQNGQAFK